MTATADAGQRLTDDDGGVLLATTTEVARELGTTARQVNAWFTRRRTSRFPEPVASVHKPVHGGRRRAPIFDLSEVYAWWIDYDPNANKGAHWAEKRAARGGH